LAVAVAAAVFVGSVSSDVVVLFWAPPVLTVTPGGACEVVDPVDVEVVVFAPPLPVADSCSAAVESVVVVEVS
jgi:hypothetical protein